MHSKNHVGMTIEMLPFQSETVGTAITFNPWTGCLDVLETQNICNSFVTKPNLIVITWDLGFLMDQQNASIHGQSQLVLGLAK
jgi:hypothetical protein